LPQREVILAELFEILLEREARAGGIAAGGGEAASDSTTAQTAPWPGDHWATTGLKP
jgi:hypothetical protein